MALHSPRSSYAHLLTPCTVCGHPYLKSDMRPVGEGKHVCRPCIRHHVKDWTDEMKAQGDLRPLAPTKKGKVLYAKTSVAPKVKKRRPRGPRYQDA